MNGALATNLERAHQAVGELTGNGVTVVRIHLERDGRPALICRPRDTADCGVSEIHGCRLVWLDRHCTPRAGAAPAVGEDAEAYANCGAEADVRHAFAGLPRGEVS